MRIVFIGPPGSGKGTQSQRLKDHLRVAHVSTGEILRDAQKAGTELGLAVAGYLDRGQFVPDDVMLGIVADRISTPDFVDGCLFDGFPRTVPQAKAFDTLLAERGAPLDMVIALDVAEEVLRKRLSSRGRHDDGESIINERFRHHRELTEPLVEYYRGRGILRSIDGHGTPGEVFARIQKAIEAAIV